MIALRLGQLRSRSHRRSSREGSAAKSAPARSARPATVFRYVFVAATACSDPAPSGSTASEALARSDAGSFVRATVKAPFRRARVTYSTTSGVRPDCERPITVEPASVGPLS